MSQPKIDIYSLNWGGPPWFVCALSRAKIDNTTIVYLDSFFQKNKMHRCLVLGTNDGVYTTQYRRDWRVFDEFFGREHWQKFLEDWKKPNE